jgi:hypothetical protein
MRRENTGRVERTVGRDGDYEAGWVKVRANEGLDDEDMSSLQRTGRRCRAHWATRRRSSSGARGGDGPRPGDSGAPQQHWMQTSAQLNRHPAPLRYGLLVHRARRRVQVPDQLVPVVQRLQHKIISFRSLSPLQLSVRRPRRRRRRARGSHPRWGPCRSRRARTATEMVLGRPVLGWLSAQSAFRRVDIAEKVEAVLADVRTRSARLSTLLTRPLTPLCAFCVSCRARQIAR